MPYLPLFSTIESVSYLEEQSVNLDGVIYYSLVIIQSVVELPIVIHSVIFSFSEIEVFLLCISFPRVWMSP